MNKPQYITPVVTAFKPDGQLDKEANIKIWNNLIEGGITGIVIMGSTGEFFALRPEQKRELIELAEQHIKGRVMFYVGTGHMRLDDTVELSNFALSRGADGVMIIGPYYFSLSDECIELYFSEAAKAISGNIFLYNFPERTSYDLKPKIALKLLKKHSNITGYKDTVGAMAHTRELISTVRNGGSDDFIILSGKDENFAHTLLSGGNGCIGGLSNLFPELSGAWVKAVNQKDMDKVSAIQKVMDTINDVSAIGTPAIPVLKKAMILRGAEMHDTCQFPFISASNEQTAKAKALLDAVETKVKAAIAAV